MPLPVRPIVDGVIVAVLLAAVLIVVRPGSGNDWKFGLALIGLALFVLAGLGGAGGGR